MRIAPQGFAARMIGCDHQAARFGKARVEGEVVRHGMQQRTKAQLPAAIGHAIDDLATRRDHDLQARQRIAFGKVPEQGNAEPRIRRRRQCERQGREGARSDLRNIGERFALFVQHGLGEAQQANAGFRQLRRAASTQQHCTQSVLEIGNRLAHGGLGKIQAFGGATEAASLHDCVETADFIALDLHGGIVSRAAASTKGTGQIRQSG